MCARVPSLLFTTPLCKMASSLAAACVPSTFNGLSIFGTNILSIDAAVVTNYTASVPAEARFTQPATEVRDATFCNVTVSYTHPGQNDNIIVETWLPLENPVWNGRLQAVGGSGWSAGRIPVSYLGMAGAIGDGFATSTTDAGMGDGQNVVGLALASPGNINWYTLNNFASVALGEQVRLTAFPYPQPIPSSPPPPLLHITNSSPLIGRNQQSPHPLVLRPPPLLLLLERLLAGRAAGHDAGAAVPGSVRRHCGRLAHPVDVARRHGALLAAAGHAPARKRRVPARL